MVITIYKNIRFIKFHAAVYSVMIEVTECCSIHVAYVVIV